jgi:uncharacterized repeat protein (TIGR01451 family)
MNGRRRSGGGIVILLAALAAPAGLYAQPLPASPGPLQEPPLAEQPRAAVPAPGREARDPPTPIVAIRVRVDSAATPGRELEYHILVDNSALADAHHVRVRATLPPKARYKTARPVPEASTNAGEVAWDIGTLKGGQRREILLVVEPTTGDDLVCCARVSFEHGECVRTRMNKPGLRVRTTGPQSARQYDPLTYVIAVTNDGSADATDVVLTEELPAGLQFSDSNPSTSGTSPLTWKLGTLAPGDRRTVEFKVIAAENGTHQLKATVAAAGMKAVEGNLSRVLVGVPKLALIMSGPTWRSLDRTATYFLTVSNSSAMPATNIILTDDLFTKAELRSFIEFAGASDDGKLTGDNVRWSLGMLSPGSRRTVSITLRSLREGSFRNFASLQADQGLTATASSTTEFQTPAGLTLDVDKLADPVAVGKTTTITLRLRQHGGTPSTSVGLSVALPDGLQYVDAGGMSAGKQDGRAVTFAPLGELAAGAEATYTITVRAERAGEAKVRANVTAEPAPKGGRIEREESMLIVPESASPAPPPAAVPDAK